jgi:hypothetical protein
MGMLNNDNDNPNDATNGNQLGEKWNYNKINYIAIIMAHNEGVHDHSYILEQP